MDGILVIDKPEGPTSHDVVDFIRRRFGIKKAGHAGTLDPIATGVLVILIGKATKRSSALINQDKVYEGSLLFGIATDTGDCQGKILHKSGSCPDEKFLREVFDSFKGKIYQTPPMFSAKKIKGKKLYELARKGIQVKREPKLVEIKELEVKGMDLPGVDFRAHVSKGTYIRQLVSDIGERAGCGAHLRRLRRISSGDFDIRNSFTFEKLKMMDEETLGENLLRI